MNYLRVSIDGAEGYQEIYQGCVTRYTDLEGATLFDQVPAGSTAVVVGDDQPAWAFPDPVADNPAPVQSSRRLTKLDFIGRIGDDVFTALLGMSHQSIEVEKFVKLIDWATPDADGTSIDLDDPRVQRLSLLEPALVAQGIVTEGWAQGVLNA